METIDEYLDTHDSNFVTLPSLYPSLISTQSSPIVLMDPIIPSIEPSIITKPWNHLHTQLITYEQTMTNLITHSYPIVSEYYIVSQIILLMQQLNTPLFIFQQQEQQVYKQQI
jgi:hypothetical protein